MLQQAGNSHQAAQRLLAQILQIAAPWPDHTASSASSNMSWTKLHLHHTTVVRLTRFGGKRLLARTILPAAPVDLNFVSLLPFQKSLHISNRVGESLLASTDSIRILAYSEISYKPRSELTLTTVPQRYTASGGQLI